MRSVACAIAVGLLLAGCGDSYTIVRVCKSPFMRVPNGKVVRRDSDGALFYADGRSMLRVDPKVSIDDVCRKQ